MLSVYSEVSRARTGAPRRPVDETFHAARVSHLVTPEIVDAIGYSRGSSSSRSGVSPFRGYSGGLSPLFIGHSLFSSAVVTMIVRARNGRPRRSLEEAAADLYAPPPPAFRQITLPLVRRRCLLGGLLSFTFSLDNTIVFQS